MKKKLKEVAQIMLTTMWSKAQMLPTFKATLNPSIGGGRGKCSWNTCQWILHNIWDHQGKCLVDSKSFNVHKTWPFGENVPSWLWNKKQKICFQMTDSLNWWKCTGNERSKILLVILDLKMTFVTATYVKVEKSQLKKHPVQMPSPPHYITQLWFYWGSV